MPLALGLGSSQKMEGIEETSRKILQIFEKAVYEGFREMISERKGSLFCYSSRNLVTKLYANMENRVESSPT